MKNRFFVVLGTAVIVTLFMTSCATHSKFYRADIVRFGDEVQTSYSYKKGPFKNVSKQSLPMDLLTDSRSFSRSLGSITPEGSNTPLYYATDLAIDRVKWVRRKVAKYDRETRYYIFLLTDGLDNASMQMARNNHQAVVVSTDAYRARIERRLRRAMDHSKNHYGLTFYTLLRRGDDIRQLASDNALSEEALTDYLNQQYSCFRYASHGAAPELIQADDYQTIAAAISEEIVNNNLDFKVAKEFRGKRVKLTITDSEGKERYVEGTLKAVLGNYTLVNLTTDGIINDSIHTPYNKAKGTKLKALPGDKKDQTVTFTLSGLRKAETGEALKVAAVKQSFYDGILWQNNSDYNKQPTFRPNAYCIFLIDGGGGLTDSELQAEKDIVKHILRILNPAL